MSWTSAIYAGDVVHARHKPRRHRLNYRVFSFLLDLDELAELDSGLRLFGYNRPAVFSFRDSDHGMGVKGGLKAWVAEHLARAGIGIDGLRVRVLCYPRMFGYVFNPLTVYFCSDADGALIAILYEVCNTFHERHTYIIPAQADQDGAVRHTCAKEMYVSPFVPMDCVYSFRIVPPGESVMIGINEVDAQGPLLYAGFTGKRRALTDSALLKCLLTYPLMTLKIMGAIHWEALRLWAKGVPIHRHEAARERIASSVIAPKSDPVHR